MSKFKPLFQSPISIHKEKCNNIQAQIRPSLRIISDYNESLKFLWDRESNPDFTSIESYKKDYTNLVRECVLNNPIQFYIENINMIEIRENIYVLPNFTIGQINQNQPEAIKISMAKDQPIYMMGEWYILPPHMKLRKNHEKDYTVIGFAPVDVFNSALDYFIQYIKWYNNKYNSKSFRSKIKKALGKKVSHPERLTFLEFIQIVIRAGPGVCQSPGDFYLSKSNTTREEEEELQSLE